MTRQKRAPMASGLARKGHDSSLPESLIRDLTAPDGIVRLYAVMNSLATDGVCTVRRRELAAIMGLATATVSRRLAQLLARDWIAFDGLEVDKDDKNVAWCPFRLFATQEDCRAWRKAHG